MPPLVERGAGGVQEGPAVLPDGKKEEKNHSWIN
jgi:hypothetical protein